MPESKMRATLHQGHFCHFEFCWKCLASYNRIRADGNTAHTNDCPWHPNQLEVNGAPEPNEEIIDEDDDPYDI
ncbi:hypothetical protein LCER1_G004090 [Lachnellula cervina]|uniref:Uncharacterized protein n=1 Tax=Lachnellula cervina TaxID=1316786 RepID=A0A7D8USK7_9HELO|nr:hypothetical protein LCER1_G004090 [Lachnellula cervina]